MLDLLGLGWLLGLVQDGLQALSQAATHRRVFWAGHNCRLGSQALIPPAQPHTRARGSRDTACPMGASDNYSQLQIRRGAFVNCHGTAPCCSVINMRQGWSSCGTYTCF
uniref:Secreted protein n=1 Tax=Mus musculus TaxID=10090 RepID=Q9D4G4_MOUSE|nr:unnamed protein product [Mus musculus]